MDRGPCKSLEDAAHALSRLRSYKPFKYSGRWYVALCGRQGVAYRSKGDLVKRLQKEGVNGPMDICILGGAK
jgi:hypothetical protein